MAEGSREGKFWKGVTSKAQKLSVRAKQKVLEKMQKAEKTKDDVYEEFVSNFKRQETGAVRMKTELVKYLNNLKFMAQSTKSLLETFRDLYEPEWSGGKEYNTVTNQKILLWEDLVSKVNGGVNDPLENYMAKFPDLKHKVAKQSRKQIDYDAARRKLEEIKVQGKDPRKVEEQYSETKQIYDELTDELYEELPSFYDSRINFYASVFHTIATSTAQFHQEIAKVDEQWSGAMEKLLEVAKSDAHSSKRDRPIDSSGCTLRSRPADEGRHGEISDGYSGSFKRSDSNEHTPEKPEKPLDTSTENNEELPMVTPPTTPASSTSAITAAKPASDDSPPTPSSTLPAVTEETPESKEAEPEQHAERKDDAKETEEETKQATEESPTKEQQPSPQLQPKEEQQPSPKSSPKIPPPKPPPLEEESGSSYKVLATHNYDGQDEDELSFEKGQTIVVIPFEDPEDQDDGWQMGKIEGTEKVGVFPENFTKKL